MLLAVVAAPAPVGADTTSRAPYRTSDPDPVDQLVWTAAAVQQLLSERDYPLALALGLVNRAVEGRGLAGAQEAVGLLAHLHENRDDFGRCRTAHPLEGALCAVEQLTLVAPAGLRGELAEEAARLVGMALRPPGSPVGQVGPAVPFASFAGIGSFAGLIGLGGPGAAPEAGAAPIVDWSGSLLDPLQSYAERELEQVWKALAGEPLLALALRGDQPDHPDLAPVDAALLLESVLEQVIGVSPMAAAAGILEGNDALRGLLERYPVIGSANTLATVMQHSHAFFNGMVGSARVSLSDLVATDSATAATLGAELGDWATNRSFVYLAAGAASLAGGIEGERVAGAIAAAGKAGADLQRLLSGFSAQLDQLGGAGSLGAIGERAAVLALSGGVFGIAANLTSVLGVVGGGGAQTAREVQALRGVVDTLRIEMHDRFAHVDVALDSMFDVLATNFDRLHVAMAEGQAASRRELAAIHQDVAALGRGLTRLEENLHSYMQAAYDQDYHRTLVRCLEHRARHLPPYDEMDFATFSGCLAEFRVRAVRDARSPILSDQSSDVSDQALLAALADPDPQNLARRLPLLARTAATRLSNPGMQVRGGVANPVEWAVASQAYLAMLYDWPEHARGMTADDLDDMAAVGRELRDVIAGITVDGPRPARTFPALLDGYERSVKSLRAQVDALMDQHQTERLRRVPLESAVAGIRAAEPDGTDLPAPEGLVEALPADLKAAAILDLDSLALVYHVTHEDSVVRDDPRRRLFVGLRPFGRIHERRHYTRTHIAVEAHFGDLGHVATYQVSGEFALRRAEQMRGGLESERVRRTVQHIPDLDRHFHDHDWPRFTADEWQTTHIDEAAVRTARNRVEATLRMHAGEVLDDLFATICSARDEPRAGATHEDARRVAASLEAMTTARTLLGAYASFGLSRSLEIRPALRESLFGEAAVHDQPTLCSTLGGGESVLRLLWLDDEPQKRLTALRRELDDVMADMDQLPEPLPLIEQTLGPLEAAARVQRLRTPDPQVH